METPGNGLLLEIFKWIGIVFAAGFIGYFGRYLSMLVIARLHKRKAESTVTQEPGQEPPPSQSDIAERSRLKVEKKRAKAEAKQAKKAVK